MKRNDIDLDELSRAAKAYVDALPAGDPMWDRTRQGILQGAVGAAENIGGGTRDDLDRALDAASCFYGHGVNVLMSAIEEWAAGKNQAELEEPSGWREAYADATRCAPETFRSCVADVRQAVGDAL